MHCCCLVAKSCLTLATPWIVAMRLLCPWDFPGKDTGVGCYFLLQGIFPTLGSNPCLSLQTDSLPLTHQGSPEVALVTSFSQVSISDHCAQENLPALALSWGSAGSPPGSSALTVEHARNFPAEPPLQHLTLARGIPALPPDVQTGPVARCPRGCLVQ